MRIVCPKCALKGQVDTVTASAKTRIACVRCATAFDAVFADGEVQSLLPQTSPAKAVIESAVSEVHAEGDVLATNAEFASTPETPHENQFDASPPVEASPVWSEDFFTSSPDLMSETIIETAQPDSQELIQELPPERVDTQAHETAGVGQDSPAPVQSLKSNGAGKVGREATDAYGMGVRLMQVSPVWLLLVGLSFISFIVFCNWLIKPTKQTGDAANLMAAANNHATNQSANRVIPQTSTAQSTTGTQVSLPSNERGVAFIPTEAKEALPQHVAAKVETVEAKPTVEEKPATQASPSNQADETKAGKVTIQIGSYNVVAEAEERVAKLKSAGFEARSIRADIPQRGTWYRVQSGRFVSRDEAERYGRQLRDKGIVSSFITTDVQE